MEDGHLSTSVENLVQIPSEFKGISEDTCDVPVCEDPSTFDALSNHSEILSDFNNDGTSSDDDSYENIEYIEASPLNLEIDSLEEVNDVDQEEEEFDLEDIFQIQDVILHEKLLKISHLVTNIESLNDNPTPDRVFKSTFSFPNPIMDSESFFKESDTSLSHLDKSLPKFETFSDHTEETRSGSTTTHANNTLPEYDSFLFEFESFHFDPSFPRPSPEPPDVEISLIIESDAPVINNFDELNEDECFDPRGYEIDVEDDDSFTFFIRTFLSFLTYPEVSPLLSSTKNEDTIFDPGTDIKELDKNKDKTRQNRARDWKERKITIPTVPSDFIGPAPTCELELNPNPSRACALQDWRANEEGFMVLIKDNEGAAVEFLKGRRFHGFRAMGSIQEWIKNEGAWN
ncbi:hypothetical protein Tco_0949735 [Tanacetum coccineum]